MVEIQHLSGAGEELSDTIPNPVRPIGYHAEPNLFFGNKACFFDGLEGRGNLLICSHLVPADQMLNSILVQKVDAKPFHLLPVAFAPFSFSGEKALGGQALVRHRQSSS